MKRLMICILSLVVVLTACSNGRSTQNKVNPIVGSYIIGGNSSGQWLDINNTFKQLSIAIGANWNALPRVPKVQSNDIDTYKTVVADIISKRGFSSNKVNIRQVLRVDLEGDGVEEVVMTASNTAIPLSDETNDNTYSIIVLRKVIDNKVENIVLREEYYTNGKGSLGYGTSALYVPFILDANGDGIMEVFVEGIYSPGSFMDVYEVKGRNVTKVLTNGVSA